MRQWPDGEDLLTLIGQSAAPGTPVRDPGTLAASAFRPRAELVGTACYRTPTDQAAALLHGIMTWQPLELWNSGLAWTAARMLLERSNSPLEMPIEQRLELTDDISSGSVDLVGQIADRLAPYVAGAHS